MNSQEKKRWLQRYRILDREINQRLDQIDALRSLAERMTSVVTGMPHGGGSKSREDIYIKLIDLSNEVNQKVDGLVDTRRVIMKCASELTKKQRMIVFEIYLRGESVYKIANEHKIDVRACKRIHARALEKIILPGI